MANEFLTKKVVKINYTWNGTDSQGVANSTVATHGTGVFIPSGAVITDAWINVTTTMGPSGTGTLALQALAANDLVSAIAINDGTTPWNAGVRGTLVTAPNLGADSAHDSALETIALFAATKIVMTSTQEVKVVIGTAALTSGAMDIYIEYLS